VDRRTLLSLFPALIVGCQSGDPSSSSVKKEPGEAARPPTKGGPIVRAEAPGAGVSWTSWEQGKTAARAQNRPIFLLVYADWCPHCRSLSKVFDDGEVQKLARSMVMVRQNADENASWLDEVAGKHGGYVPRVFFLRADATLRPEIKSDDARFPYFYTPEGIETLKRSMKRASEA
jgi:thiol-disulfide isomerase/thioredoxin